MVREFKDIVDKFASKKWFCKTDNLFLRFY
jgi:hypothetical protein